MSSTAQVTGTKAATDTEAQGAAMSTTVLDNQEFTRSGSQERPGAGGPPARRILAGVASVAINFAAPLLAYYVIRPHTPSSVMALALSGLIPVIYTLVIAVIQRKFSALGMAGVVLFSAGVGISWICGGNPLALELQEPVVFGLFGLACLVSVVIGRPLHQVILRRMGRSNPHYAQVADRVPARTSTFNTAVIGLACLGHAVALIVLALTQTTSTFVALQRPVGLPFLVLGFGGLFLYNKRQQGRRQAAQSESAQSESAQSESAR